MTWYYIACTILFGALAYKWDDKPYGDLLTKIVMTIMCLVSVLLLLENLGYIEAN